MESGAPANWRMVSVKPTAPSAATIAMLAQRGQPSSQSQIVEAGIVASPFDARWTSFPATAGLARAPSFLRVGEMLGEFGDEPIEARRRYVEFVVGEPLDMPTAVEGHLHPAATFG